MIAKNCFKLLILMFSLALIGVTARARPEYLKIFAADPYSRPELRTKCSVCHLNPAGGGDRNDFGKAFAAAGLTITPELRLKFPDRFLTPEAVQGQSPPVTFPSGTQSEAVIEFNGKKYLINTQDKTVSLLSAERSGTPPPKGPSVQEAKDENTAAFEPVDVRLVNLPTAIRFPRHSLWVDFTHRFPFNEVSDNVQLFGLDGFAVPSFGFIYGITNRIHAGAYRSSSLVGRPIELFVGANLLEERRGHPFSLMGRVALEGRDNFRRNFTTSFELTLARSITSRAQIYVVPTVSLGDRPLGIAPEQNFKGRTAVALGIGAAVNVRPSVALMAEANMRLNEESRYTTRAPGSGLGIHRPVVGFGIQKASASRRHSFTLTFSNGPGTSPSQRSMTRGLFFNDDSFRGMSIGFNLTRRLF